MVLNRLEAFRRIGIGIAAVRCRLNRLSSPSCLLTDLDIKSAGRNIAHVWFAYHLVHGYRAICDRNKAYNDAEDIIPCIVSAIAILRVTSSAYMTVLFFCLYLACIWSILGTAPCLASPVVLFELIHRRAAGTASFWVRGTRARDREHAVHIHGCAMRA